MKKTKKKCFCDTLGYIHVWHDAIWSNECGGEFSYGYGYSFIGEKYKFIFIYSDGITLFTKLDKEHLKHLKKTFLKCKNYGLF